VGGLESSREDGTEEREDSGDVDATNTTDPMGVDGDSPLGGGDGVVDDSGKDDGDHDEEEGGVGDPRCGPCLSVGALSNRHSSSERGHIGVHDMRHEEEGGQQQQDYEEEEG